MDSEDIHVGESSKVRSLLDILSISKILSLVMGILGFLLAAWSAWPMIYGAWSGIFSSIYWIAGAIINLMFYMKIDEFEGMIKKRKYAEVQNLMVVWIVLTLVFGVIVGILLLIGYIELNDLKRGGVSYDEKNVVDLPPPPQ